MSCQCYQIGGPFIAEDPDCPAHGTEAQAREREREAELESLRADAARYRAVRRKVCIVGAFRDGARFHLLNLDPIEDWGNRMASEVLDAAIDAAMNP